MEKDNEYLLEVKDLKTYFKTEAGIAKAVNGVSFNLKKGEILGIVGESGSGKSVTSLSVLRLIPEPPGFYEGGEVIYNGTNLLDLTYDEMRDYRGKEISMIFQEPMTSLNPVTSIKSQLVETVLTHDPSVSDEEAEKRAVDILEKVGIPDPEKRLKDYPFQYSGGMRQRVMIAMALINHPRLLIADEPTTALDVTIQAQILDLIKEIQSKDKDSAVMFITHDLAVVSELCDRAMVMYGGRVQEIAEINELYNNPAHPYTKGLMNSIPRPGEKQEKLQPIPGMVPSIFNMPKGCKFCTRCEYVMDKCHTEEPELIEIKEGHFVRCHLKGNYSGK